MWVLIITVNLFLNAVLTISTERFEILYGAVVYCISILMACLPFIGNHYGPAGAWCWVQEGDDVWRFAVWYIPLFLLIGVMFIVYIIIVYRVNRQAGLWQGSYSPDQERQRAMLKEFVKPLKIYPLIYMILFIFPLINRLQNAISKSSEPIFAITLLHAVSSPLHGFINAVVYGLNPDTRSRLTWLQIKLALMKKCSATVIGEYKVDESPLEETPQVDQSQNTDQASVVEEGDSADQSRGVVDREPATLTINVDLPQMDPQVTFGSLQKDSVTAHVDC
ncbi:Cyclic AMP receptor-like protein A [Holothuria leucospilota]|uniref:Cyclic AMP receptor-like protein A n=1 Tax=Holothuria leucospilota TaxID=206669 RepID=A0A9Q1HAG1_HOLLE|nr:Cyclic AMP receptor-like protein A [Holothuria leucospilota]